MLIELLKKAGGIARNGSSLPILNGMVRLKSDGANLSVEASNLNQWFHGVAPTRWGKLDTVVELHRLESALALLGEPEVTVTEAAVIFQSGKSKITVPAMDPDEWPEMPQPKGERPGIRVDDLVGLMEFTGTDEFRMAMTGIYVGSEAVATNAHVLACIKGLKSENPILLPKEFSRWSGELIVDGEGHAFAENPTWWVGTRLLDAAYPNYQSVIPKGLPHKIVVNRPGLVKLLKNPDIKNLPIIGLSNGMLTGEDLDLGFSVSVEAPVQMEGSVGMNPKYLATFLQFFEGDTLEIGWVGPTKPLVAENDTRLALVMPVLLSGAQEPPKAEEVVEEVDPLNIEI